MSASSNVTLTRTLTRPLSNPGQASTSQPQQPEQPRRSEHRRPSPPTRKASPLPARRELGEGVGEFPERVTHQESAMIGPKTMTPRRARWTPTEKSIHTAIETTTPCQTSVTTPVKNPPSSPIRDERSSASWRMRRQCMLADFGPNRAVDRADDIVVKGWTAMSVRISHLTAGQEQRPARRLKAALRLVRKETS